MASQCIYFCFRELGPLLTAVVVEPNRQRESEVTNASSYVWLDILMYNHFAIKWGVR